MAFNTDIERQIRSHVVEMLEQKMRERGMEAGEMDDDFAFIGSGAIDSLGFLELLASIESRFDVDIDFSEKDPSEFLSLGGFVKSILSMEDQNGESQSGLG